MFLENESLFLQTFFLVLFIYLFSYFPQVVWASGNSDTVDLSVAHTKRGSIKNTFIIDSTSPTPVGGTTPAGGTTNSPSPSTSDDDESNKIEKELRVDGLDKFATVDPSKKLGMVVVY